LIVLSSLASFCRNTCGSDGYEDRGRRSQGAKSALGLFRQSDLRTVIRSRQALPPLIPFSILQKSSFPQNAIRAPVFRACGQSHRPMPIRLILYQ
jgi:hypothetical protein